MATSEPKAGERVLDVRVADDDLSVDLVDGRTVTVPLAWYPRLLHATPAERAHWRIAGGGFGIHWPDIDEDLSTAGLLRGAPAPGALATAAASKAGPHNGASRSRSTGFSAELEWKRIGKYIQNPPEPSQVRFTVQMRSGFKYERRVALNSFVTTSEAATFLNMPPADLRRLVKGDPQRFELRKRGGVLVVRLRAVLQYGLESGRVELRTGAFLTN